MHTARPSLPVVGAGNSRARPPGGQSEPLGMGDQIRDLWVSRRLGLLSRSGGGRPPCQNLSCPRLHDQNTDRMT